MHSKPSLLLSSFDNLRKSNEELRNVNESLAKKYDIVIREMEHMQDVINKLAEINLYYEDLCSGHRNQQQS